jgi:hypothetical protein
LPAAAGSYLHNVNVVPKHGVFIGYRGMEVKLHVIHIAALLVAE